jgi:hypothetical protein
MREPAAGGVCRGVRKHHPPAVGWTQPCWRALNFSPGAEKLKHDFASLLERLSGRVGWAAVAASAWSSSPAEPLGSKRDMTEAAGMRHTPPLTLREAALLKEASVFSLAEPAIHLH